MNQGSDVNGILNNLVTAFSGGEGSLVQQHKEQVKQLSGFIDQCGATDVDQSLSVESDSPLTRMLMN